ncbi:hypothetical protein Tco_1041744 [Tanacetum coccineum]|uniref:Uncharacterized protein n=1 Tax=Tanacetum coccineum TaxID=301880 RepID=A0ABQ5GIL3_9ASTR
MDDPNITMEEYIRLEEEKARKHGKVFNWETAKYGKIWYDEDVHDLRSVETEFPAIVFNDNLTSNETLSCEPTVSSLNNNEIDFRISFDESDDEDYTVVFDKNSFSYKIISTNDLKTDSENDNEKVNMPLFPSPEPSVSCIDDLDFFKDFENEFPAIVYNDALTSKSDFSTEPTLCPQHIDEFDLKDETSLSEYDEVEQNVLNPEVELRVDCYCNAGFETDRDEIKSQTGYANLNEGVWLGIVPTINEPIKMFCDNSAALLIANEPGVQRGARHYHRRYLLKVHTYENLADPFTKALPKESYSSMLRAWGLSF